MTRRRRALAASALAAVVLAVGAAAPASAQEAAPDDDGLRLEVDTTYRVDPVAGMVDVVLDVSATNTLEDVPDEFGVTRFYFDEVVFLIPLEARSIAATDEDGSLDFRVLERADDGIVEIGVALAPRLYSGSTAELEISFTLPGDEPRSDGDLRVNEAFIWFYVWAYGDPGMSTVAVEMPTRFGVEILGDPLELDGQMWRSGVIEDPSAWVAVVSGRDDTALELSEVVIGGATVELAAWPDDGEWAEEVERVLGEGIPVLEDLTGFEWNTRLRITQSFAPYIRGYAGWFDGASDEVEIGEELDAHVILHEVSHVWFDDALFGERWITEGLADTFAAQAVERLGRDRRDQPGVDRGDPVAVPLNLWTDPTFDDRTVDRTEDYAYAAAWHVVDAITAEIGVDRIADVLAAASGDLIAYQGDTAPEPVEANDDWRRFLDLLEQVGGSNTAEQLFRDWVVTDSQMAEMDRRAEVRNEYRAVEGVAGEWSMPLELRSAMGAWDFDAADGLLDGAASVLAARDALALAAEAVGAVPPSLEERFEAGDDADVLAAELAAQTVVVVSVGTAADVVERPRTIVEHVGLWGSDPDGELQAAITAVEAGRLGDGAEFAEAAQRSIAEAEQNGLIRLGVAGALLVVGTVVLFVVRRRRQNPPAAVETLVSQ